MDIQWISLCFGLHFEVTFVDLTNEDIHTKSIYQSIEFKNWFKIYKRRKFSKNFVKLKSNKLMEENNPVIIPRNNVVEDVLESADKGDFIPLEKFLKVLENPYNYKTEIPNYYKSTNDIRETYVTYCGT